MYVTVVPSSRSSYSANGLSYASSLPLSLGQLVRVPFGRQQIEGVVVEVMQQKPIGNFELKDVSEALGDLLDPSHVHVARWMAQYYCCSLRQALAVWLPGTTWQKLLVDVAIEKQDSQQSAPTLLFGPQRRSAYDERIQQTLKQGRSVIVLVPDILLAQQYEKHATIIHGKLTPKQRREAWQQCRSGEARLVVGSRAALFAPVQNLGLVIIDEEHEWTYKNEQTPRYSACRVAEVLCKETGAQLLLGSSTPSLESWVKAQRGEYWLEECVRSTGPTVQVVDLGQVDCNKYYPLSPTLINAIRYRLQHNEQSALLFNRRGFATAMLCMECRERLEDPETHLPYTVHHHNAESYLLSHHTGERLNVPARCPKCQSTTLREVGAGTQRIEEHLRELAPNARIARADADTLKSVAAMRSLLAALKSGSIDIVLGTQSVLRCLDLPNLTLAAVLLADTGLSLPHFRAGERVFQLLCQLTGRPGLREVIIQTFRPNAVEIALASKHAVREYLEQEHKSRTATRYPPDTEMVRLVFSGAHAQRESERLYKSIQDSGVQVSRTPSLFSHGKWFVFLRGKDLSEPLKRLPNFNGIIDRDPVECV